MILVCYLPALSSAASATQAIGCIWTICRAAHDAGRIVARPALNRLHEWTNPFADFMQCVMLRCRQDLQILDAVVGWITVAVMNMLGRIQLPSEMLLHNKAMLIHPATARQGDADVSVRRGCPATIPTWCGCAGLVFCAAGLRAIPALATLYIRGVGLKRGPAVQAVAGDTIGLHRNLPFRCHSGGVTAPPGLPIHKPILPLFGAWPERFDVLLRRLGAVALERRDAA